VVARGARGVFCPWQKFTFHGGALSVLDAVEGDGDEQGQNLEKSFHRTRIDRIFDLYL
jgi:hypothetical protein